MPNELLHIVDPIRFVVHVALVDFRIVVPETVLGIVDWESLPGNYVPGCMHHNRNFEPVVAVVGDNDAGNPVEAAMMVRTVSLIHMAIEIESRSPDIPNIQHLALVETPERVLDLAIQWIGSLPPVGPDLADFRVAP